MPVVEGEAAWPGEQGRRLESWKEIARYLNRQVRTVQRWEEEEGLPVHRLSHKKRGNVFAYTHELDAWWATRAAEPAADAAEVASESPAISVQDPTDDRKGRGWSDKRFGAAAVVFLGLSVGIIVLVAVLTRSGRGVPVSHLLSPATTPRFFAAATTDGTRMRLIPSLATSRQFLALSPDGRLLYAADQGGNLQIIRTADDQVAGRVSIPPRVSGIAMSRDGRSVYLAHVEIASLTILDTTTRSLRYVPITSPALDLALSADGRTIYLTMPYRGIDRIDAATLTESLLAAPACPQYLALPADGERMYVSFQCGQPGGHDPINVLTPGGGLVARWQGPPLVGSFVAVSPDGRELWASAGNACEAPQYDGRGCPSVPAELLYVFDTSTGTLLRTVTGESQRFGAIVFLPGGLEAVDGAYILDTTRFSRLEKLPPSDFSLGRPVLSREGTQLYFPLSHAGTGGIADFTAPTKSCRPPTNQLVSWWPGDGTADDAWALADGELSSAATYAPGIVGQAFDLTKPGASVSFPGDEDLGGQLETRTIAAWVKFASAGRTALLDQFSGAGSHRHGWWLGKDIDDRLAVRIGVAIGTSVTSGSTVLRGVTPLRLGTWYHVAVIANQGQFALFLNGREESHAVLDTLASADVAGDLRLGTDGVFESPVGLVDELVVYDRAIDLNDLESLVQMPACIVGR